MQVATESHTKSGKLAAGSFKEPFMETTSRNLYHVKAILEAHMNRTYLTVKQSEDHENEEEWQSAEQLRRKIPKLLGGKGVLRSLSTHFNKSEKR